QRGAPRASGPAPGPPGPGRDLPPSWVPRSPSPLAGPTGPPGRAKRGTAHFPISGAAIKVIGSRLRLEDDLASRAGADAQRAGELLADRASTGQAVEEHREGRDLGVGLVADRDVPGDQD